MHPVGANCRIRRPAAAFTLIEVLVVVAIIALLVAILLPSLARAKANARTVVCTTQIRQLMAAALMYKTEFQDRLPGVGRSDSNYAGDYDSGARKDWLTWLGTWTVMIKWPDVQTAKMWANTPRGGRLWKYYKDPKLLLCPAALRSNGKTSYSTPENVALAVKDPTPTSSPKHRDGLPPQMDRVKTPAAAIQFLDEDEDFGITSYSIDDGFGEPDIFCDRHLGKATVAFFDGHANAYFYPRGPGTNPGEPKVRYPQNKSPECFRAWMIQIAPFNCRYTPAPWKFKSVKQSMPKFKSDANWPYNACRSEGPGCE